MPLSLSEILSRFFRISWDYVGFFGIIRDSLGLGGVKLHKGRDHALSRFEN